MRAFLVCCALFACASAAVVSPYPVTYPTTTITTSTVNGMPMTAGVPVAGMPGVGGMPFSPYAASPYATSPYATGYPATSPLAGYPNSLTHPLVGATMNMNGLPTSLNGVNGMNGLNGINTLNNLNLAGNLLGASGVTANGLSNLNNALGAAANTLQQQSDLNMMNQLNKQNQLAQQQMANQLANQQHVLGGASINTQNPFYNAGSKECSCCPCCSANVRPYPTPTAAPPLPPTSALTDADKKANAWIASMGSKLAVQPAKSFMTRETPSAMRYRQYPNIGTGVSGSGQPSVSDFSTIKDQTKANSLIMLDVREEPHFFLDGKSISYKVEPLESSQWYHLRTIDVVDTELRLLNSVTSPVELWEHNTGTAGDAFDTKNAHAVAFSGRMTEEAAARAAGVTYYRVAITEDQRPEDRDVDSLMIIFRQAEKDRSWIHVHGRDGFGRTNLVMVMYNIFWEANKRSLVDIVKSHPTVNLLDLLDMLPSADSQFNLQFNPFTTPIKEKAPTADISKQFLWKMERAQFLAYFWQFMNTNYDKIHTASTKAVPTWSAYAASMRRRYTGGVSYTYQGELYTDLYANPSVGYNPMLSGVTISNTGAVVGSAYRQLYNAQVYYGNPAYNGHGYNGQYGAAVPSVKQKPVTIPAPAPGAANVNTAAVAAGGYAGSPTGLNVNNIPSVIL